MANKQHAIKIKTRRRVPFHVWIMLDIVLGNGPASR